jgi:hypothetical protein
MRNVRMRHIATWLGGASGAVIHALLVAFLGVYLPWRLGLDLLDPLVVIPYWCTSLLFVAGATAEAFSPEVPAGVARRQMLATVTMYGFAYGTLISTLALLTVNVSNWHGRVLLPAGAVLWTAPLLSLSASACMAAIGARLAAEGHTAQSVKSLLRGTLWGIALLLIAGPSLAPAAVREWIGPHLTTGELPWLCLAASLLLTSIALQQSAPRS